MGLTGIGESARLSRLSPKALHLYDELGLLPPARVDLDSGYRWYACGQLDQARLVASLRQIGVRPALKSGDRLPSIRSISQEFEVATTTAQKVIEALRDEGLAETSPIGHVRPVGTT